MRIIPFDEKFQQAVIALILHIQNDEAGIGLSLEEQPDLLDIPRAYAAPGGFWLAVEGEELLGTIAVLGPTRMEYGKAMSLLGYMNEHLSDVVRRLGWQG